jgi:hypothetical protein
VDSEALSSSCFPNTTLSERKRDRKQLSRTFTNEVSYNMTISRYDFCFTSLSHVESLHEANYLHARESILRS